MDTVIGTPTNDALSIATSGRKESEMTATVSHYLRLPEKPDQYTILGGTTTDSAKLVDAIRDRAASHDFRDEPEIRTDDRGNASWVFRREDGATFASTFHVVMNGYRWPASPNHPHVFPY